MKTLMNLTQRRSRGSCGPMRIAATVLAVLIAGVFAEARADLVSELSKEEISDLKSGDVVVRPKDRGGVWPELTVYTLIKAPVSTVEKVLRDYEHAHEFQAGLVSAKVLEHPNPDTYVVEYTSKVPILGSMSNTVRNTFTSDDDGVNVAWNLVKSSSADISEGSLRVEPFENGSIMRYTNYVKPKSSVAALAKGAALKEVKKTVNEIKTEAEKRAK